MNLHETLTQLEALGNEKMRAFNAKHGAGEQQYGVKLGDIRTLSKKIKTNHALGLALWETGYLEARLLAILIMKPKMLSITALEVMVQSIDFAQLATWMNSYIVKKHPDKEVLRQKWMVSMHPMVARAGWSLTAERVAKNPEGLDLKSLLDRIEDEMAAAPEVSQWTMNCCLAEIGIHFPEYRQRAIAIGEALGIYRDYPVSKGCTSPFAPIWINEMVRRQG